MQGQCVFVIIKKVNDNDTAVIQKKNIHVNFLII